MSLFGRQGFADGDQLEVAGAAVRLKVNRRSSRVSLRLDRTRREIVATAPSPRRLAEAAAFARERASWIAERLAVAPLEVADYVAAHECAHLLELNHGPRFWAHVRTLVGDERRHRAWLRTEGARLHAFGR